jgi:iron(II)-dependent oxidoreductase
MAAAEARLTADEAACLASWVLDARRRTALLTDDLEGDRLLGPRLPIVNPILWELGHLAWFQEKWCLRRGGAPSVRSDADAIFDSTAVAHDTRWDLPLPPRREVRAYMAEVTDRVLDGLRRGPLTAAEAYFVRLAVFHEDMHGEAFAYTRQTLGYPRPPLGPEDGPVPGADATDREGEDLGDAEVPGGEFLLGAVPGAEPFVFDNEKWGHPLTVAPFRIARRAVTQREFARFVDDGGYDRDDLWSDEGRSWRVGAGAVSPLHWRRGPAGWERREFDRWIPLEPDLPVVHVNGFEAEAYCRWTGRRLPTEAEWEVAASGEPDRTGRRLSATRRAFPWGGEPPTPERANLDGVAGRAVGASRLSAGESAFGCRQMIGNVWEWTADAFRPYPGFVPDPYREYSQPWFGTHRVLRGGAWITRSRLLRTTWRNFYTPDRRDVWAGFRTCAR